MSLNSALLDLKNLLKCFNFGSVDQLRSLPRMSSNKIDQIIKLRSKGHMTLCDIINIRGIGPKTLATMSHNNRVSDIVEICQYFHSIYGKIKFPSSVVSLDLGLSNTAVAHLSMDMRLLEWERIELVLVRPYSLEACYEQVSRLFHSLPSASVYLFESQSHRTLRTHTGYLDISLRLRLLESVFYTIAREQGVTIYGISPKKVGRYFELGSCQYYHKKRAAIVTTSHLLGVDGLEKVSTPLGIFLNAPNSLCNYYWSQKKMDDLSDCLLQSIAFYEWTYISQL